MSQMSMQRYDVMSVTNDRMLSRHMWHKHYTMSTLLSSARLWCVCVFLYSPRCQRQ